MLGNRWEEMCLPHKELNCKCLLLQMKPFRRFGKNGAYRMVSMYAFIRNMREAEAMRFPLA